MRNLWHTQMESRERSTRASLLIEIALVVPLLMVLVAGIADASMAFRIKHVLQVAAREGARVASTTQADNTNALVPDVTLIVNEILQQSGVDVTKREIFVEQDPILGFGVNNPVIVRLTYKYDTIFHGIVPVFNGVIPLSASSTLRYEGSGG